MLIQKIAQFKMSSVMGSYDIDIVFFLKWTKITWQIEYILSVHLHLVNTAFRIWSNKDSALIS